jgi:hypothetical protein
MRFEFARGAEIRVNLVLAGIVVGLVGVAGGVAKLLGMIPRNSRFSDVPLGITIFGSALYMVGRAVQIVRAIRSRG